MDPEMHVRGLPARPRTDIRSDVEEVWCFRGSERVGESEFLDRIEKEPGGRIGKFEMVASGARRDFRVVLRRRRRIKYLEHVAAYLPEPLSLEIMLPGFLPGEPPAWVGVGRPSIYDGGPGAAAQVLSTIRESPEPPASWTVRRTSF
jgi:hypothetical protein